MDSSVHLKTIELEKIAIDDILVLQFEDKRLEWSSTILQSETFVMQRSLTLICVCFALGFWLCGTAADAAVEKSEQEKSWEKTLKQGVDALDTNKYWLAEPLLKQAVVEAANFGAEDLRLAKSYSELGRLYTVRGKFSDAEPLLEEELFIKQQTLDEEGDQVVPAMGSMVKFYLNYGSKDKADKLCSEMLQIVEGKLAAAASGPKSKATKVGKTYMLEAWAGVASQAVRDPFLEWAIACDAVGNVYMAQKDFDRAEQLYKAALEVKETVYGKTHLSLANSYDSLGTLALARKNYAAAESHLKDAYEMTAKILPKSNPQVFGRLDKYAKCLAQDGKRAEAQQLYSAAQACWKDAKEPSSDAIRACFALGNLYCEDKDFVSAEPLLKRAMDEARTYYGESSESVVPYIQRYAYALYYLGRKPESDEFKALAASITGDVIPVAEVPKKVAGNESAGTGSGTTH